MGGGREQVDLRLALSVPKLLEYLESFLRGLHGTLRLVPGQQDLEGRQQHRRLAPPEVRLVAQCQSDLHRTQCLVGALHALLDEVCIHDGLEQIHLAFPVTQLPEQGNGILNNSHGRLGLRLRDVYHREDLQSLCFSLHVVPVAEGRQCIHHNLQSILLALAVRPCQMSLDGRLQHGDFSTGVADSAQDVLRVLCYSGCPVMLLLGKVGLGHCLQSHSLVLLVSLVVKALCGFFGGFQCLRRPCVLVLQLGIDHQLNHRILPGLVCNLLEQLHRLPSRGYGLLRQLHGEARPRQEPEHRGLPAAVP
mmetsp:Transcript_122178/g.390774  ORF Transcript_122178/g.390774 Transcript_122178/m.390774 type:complete len:306 (+) Transcript_122178:1861-2778(+)